MDLTSGELQRLSTPPVAHRESAGLKRSGEGFQVELGTDEGSPATPTWQTVIRCFTWGGDRQQDLQIPGSHHLFSPDGRWVAWEEWPAGDLAPATVIADAASLQPRLQALGTTPCFAMAGGGGSPWLADSSGLVVDTAAGYRLLTLGGGLEERPAFAGLTWKEEPQPAPDQADRFAVGRAAIVNGAGTEALGVTLENYVTPASLAPWGEGSDELRFALPPPPRGGACREVPPMEARVRFPAGPLPAFPLVVQSGGPCVELRDRPHGSGRSTACLADGTRLAPGRERPDSPGLNWVDQSWWLFVRTEQGESGWISLAGEPIAWAVP